MLDGGRKRAREEGGKEYDSELVYQSTDDWLNWNLFCLILDKEAFWESTFSCVSILAETNKNNRPPAPKTHPTATQFPHPC